MSRRTIEVDDRLYDYMLDVSLREPDVLRRLREETAAHPRANMQISPEQGQLMRLLVQMLGVRRAIEVGTFTGYSALCVAMAMPEDGQLVACDVSEEYTAIARRYWDEAKLASKIDLRIAPALDTLAALVDDGQAGTYDFVFLDADKSNYPKYYEHALTLLRPGGVVGVDNVLWGGSVADSDDQENDTVAIRELNARIGKDERVDLSMIPIGDGLTLARKR